jgi:hypothetical protein
MNITGLKNEILDEKFVRNLNNLKNIVEKLRLK